MEGGEYVDGDLWLLRPRKRVRVLGEEAREGVAPTQSCVKYG